MTRRRVADLCGWLLLAGLVCCSSCQAVSSTIENKTGQSESKPRVFSPRMDYDEWTPLGRGDPLKNNPTFDYVPPVLDRVQYWLDSHTTEPSTKRDILVLGVTAKKTSPKIPEQFLKFVDGPKFTRSNQDVSFRNDYTGSTGAEPPKVLRTSNFRNGPIDYRNQNRIQSVPASYYPSLYYNQKSKPYTMMLPPPLVQKDKLVSFAEPTQQFSTQTEEGPVIQESQFYAIPSKNYNQHQPPPQTPAKSQNLSKPPNKGAMVSQIETIKSVYAPSSAQPTKSRYESITTPSVSFEKSNLIYQSTQTLSGGWPSNGPVSTPTTSDASQSGWRTPDYPRDQYEIDHHVAASSNHEVVVKQNANIIVDGDSNENEEVVMGQKEASSEKLAPTTANVRPPANSSLERVKENVDEESSEKMHIVVANSPASLDIESQKANKGPVAVVMPINYSEKKPNVSSSDSMQSTPSVPTNSTMEVEASSEKAPKAQPQPVRNSVTISPVFYEDPQSSAVSPNRMIPSHLQHPVSQPTGMPPLSRFPVNPMHAFGPPQAPLQSMMHSQSRPNHAMMHFLGSMRPNLGFRMPGPMSMFPPMAHIHAPPAKPMMNHMGAASMPMDQSHRPPQMQDFAMGFTNPPASSSLTIQAMGAEEHPFDHHRSRLPDTTTLITTPTPFLPTASPTENSPVVVDTKDTEVKNQSPLGSILTNEREESTRPPATTAPQVTTVPSLTTDPIFSHYKQPAKPLRGPMYLIIQGHSKVKTYKPTVTKHDLPTQKNEIVEGVTERQISKFEQFIKENTKNINVNNVNAEKKKAEEKARAEKLAQAHQDSLMSLVESGLGSFTVSPSSSATEEEHQANSVTTIEINGN
ncbi:mucin-2 [Hylaeus volcanicus]|uniref:mucin-2 n=1 Tax=Hylaeus volcanicus TaxID=313075 RepID=UPI0023B87916|nr:mucin-2 [Hylaeus volcanicus]